MTIDSKDSRSYDYWFRLHIYKKKAWSQFLVTRSLCIGLRIARNVETSNAESPHADVWLTPLTQDTRICPGSQCRNTTHLLGAFPLLCSWHFVWSCEVHTQSKPKRKGTPLYVNVIKPSSNPVGLSVEFWRCKYNKKKINHATLDKENVVFRLTSWNLHGFR